MNQMRWEPLHPPPPPPPQPLPASAAFFGDRDEFFRLVVRGAALELVTVGFYRFWLATDIRRHLWSHTVVDGDALEYTGRAKELLLGFLFALAILAPVYLAYFIAGLEAERFKAFASTPLFAFFYLFGQFAIYRARRYRLTRTVWRGVRFWMTGSGWTFAVRAAIWGLLTLLTLGLLWPWRAAALERYKMQHSHYGDLQGNFGGRGWDFFKRGWWLWLLAIILPATLLLSTYVPFVPLLVFVASPFIYGGFKAIEWSWWISGIQFGNVRFKSTLESEALISLYWKVIGWFALILMFFVAYFFLCQGLLIGMSKVSIANFLTASNLKAQIPMLVLMGIGYLATVLAANVVMRVYLVRDIWARIAASTTVLHADELANVLAKGDPAGALGEGLADGLDVAGF